MLTSNSVPAAKAMSITGKIYKTYNTPAMLAELTDFKLKAAGVDDKEERKLVMAAVRKAGYKPSAATSRSKQTTLDDPGSSTGTTRRDMSVAGPSGSTAATPRTQHSAAAAPAPSVRRKRKREDRNEFLPDRSAEELEEETYGSLEFNEVLDEEVLFGSYLRSITGLRSAISSLSSRPPPPRQR
ncbi:hypothetical protein NM688_g6253 [Phlebia brevispora]|uniref:Uncharacterized protein n=1 Tax=Phlebia brevispora TaxID=194682 RepID=A0ACC1SI64_9APHY|nr:hypothetical protein NM688_g6253 [Phlebia brevispora]